MNRIGIKLLVILWIASISNIVASETIDNPPVAPDINISDSNTSDSNGTIDNPPVAPDINTSDSNISDSNTSIVNPPSTPDSNISDSNTSIVNPPSTPDSNISDSNTSIVNPPSIPDSDISDSNTSIVNPPSIPDSDISDSNTSIVNPPATPQVEEKPFDYIIGYVKLPKDSTFEAKVELFTYDKVIRWDDIDKNGFFAVQLPKIDENQSKRYFIRIKTFENSIETDYFVNGATREIVLANSVDYVFNRDVAQFLPNIEPLTVTTDTEDIGIIDLTELENSLGKVSGLIIANGDMDFSFEAINIATGETIQFDNENLGYNNFGFKLPKGESYVLILHTIDDSYYLGYRDENSTDIEIFSENELDFNSSGVPQLGGYITINQDTQFNINLINYLNSLYSISGTITTEQEDNITVTALDSSTGKFLGSTILEATPTSSNNYSLVLGRDLEDRNISFYLTFEHQPDNVYIYDSLKSGVRLIQVGDFVEGSIGAIPNPSLYTPIKLSSKSTSIPLDLTAIKIFTIDGNVTVPSNFNLGVVCKDNNGSLYYGNDCNSSMKKVGLNSVSLQFISIETNTSNWIDIGDEQSYSFESDTYQTILPVLHLTQYFDTVGETLHWEYILNDLGNAKSFVPFDKVVDIPKVSLSDINNSINLNFDITNLITNRWVISGDIELGDFDKLFISVLDSSDNSVLGVIDVNSSSSYTIPLNKFADNNSLNNGVIFELTLSKDGEDDEVFYFDGEKLTPFEKINFVNLGDNNWIIDTNSSGLLNLSDTNINRILDINIPNLLSQLESSAHKVYGTVSGDANSSIAIQLYNIDTQDIATSLSVQLDDNGDGNYSIPIFDSGNYMILVTIGDEIFFYNGEKLLNSNYFDGYPQPISLDSQIDLNVSFSALYQSSLSISGIFEDSEEFNNSTISVYSTSGKWLGEGVIVDGNYSILLPQAQAGDEVILKISDGEDSYYLGSNNILLDTQSVENDINGSFKFPSTFKPIILKDKSSQNGNLREMVQFLSQYKYKIYGQITSLSGDAIGQLIDIKNGIYFDGVELYDGNYSIEVPNGGEYVLYIFDGVNELFYDFNNSKFIPANSVDLIEVNGVWVPNPKESGSIVLTSNERQKRLDLDFSNINSMVLNLSGTILFPSKEILGSSLDGQVKRDAYISIVDKVLGDEVGFTQIDSYTNRSTTDGIEYDFNISIDNSEMATRQLVFKIYLYEENGASFRSKELFYDFTTGEVENAKVTKWQDINSFEASTSRDNLYIDLSNFGSEDNFLNIKINRPLSFLLPKEGNSINLYLLSKDGNFIDYATIQEDKNISFNLGSKADKYLLYLDFTHIDTLSPEKSFTKDFYLDFPDNNISSLNVIREDDIDFIVINGEYVPKISPLYVDRNLSLVVDIQDRDSFEVLGDITFTSSIGWEPKRAVLKDYKSGKEYISIVSDSQYFFKDVADGNYTLKVLGEDRDGKALTLFATDSGNLNIDEVSWRLKRDGKDFYYAPENVSIFEINQDNTISINLGTVGKDIKTYDVNISINRDVKRGELFIPNSSTSYYLNCKRGDCVVNSDNTTLPFVDVASKDGYYLQVEIDNKEYTYNPATQQLESGVDWIAVDESGNQVCSTSDWDCNWSDSYSWIWKPDVESMNIDSDLNMELSTAQESKLSGNISFGSSYRDEYFTLFIYQLDGSVYEIYQTVSDSQGDINISLPLKPLEDYRVEIFGGDNYFVLSGDDSSGYKLISSGNSWASDFSAPKPETLFDLTSDLDFGHITLSYLHELNITIENVDIDEDVFVKLYGDTQSFSGSNINTIDQISISVEDGDYKMVVYPSKHQSGFAVEEGSDKNFTKFDWNSSNAVVLNITDDENIVVSLPSNDDLRTISGTVNLGDGDIEGGWIEAYSPYNRRGAIVEDNGSYIIEGLKPSLDYNYTLEYYSWNLDNVVISKDVGVWANGNLENFDIEKSSISYKISGTISYSGEDNVELRAMLMTYDRDSGKWRVVSKQKLAGDGSYLFDNIQPIAGKTFLIAAGVRVKNSYGVKYRKFNATDGDSNYSIADLNSSISVTFVQESE